MEFDWNPAKCAKNIAERGIDFADVLVGFADPAKKVARDNRKDYGEERSNMLAKVEGRVLPQQDDVELRQRLAAGFTERKVVAGLVAHTEDLHRGHQFLALQ